MAKRMPQVRECAMEMCSYNVSKQCHAGAITIGDTVCPMCDTYVDGESKAGYASTLGQVGACKVSQCEYNKSLECHASRIDVSLHSGHPDCATYEPK